MKKSILACALVCVIWGFVGEAQSQEYIGAIIQSYCQTYLKAKSNPTNVNSSDALESGVCMGYVRGFRETAELMQLATKKQALCIPEKADIDQLIGIALDYLENKSNVELLQPAATLTMLAFLEAFPCKGGE